MRKCAPLCRQEMRSETYFNFPKPQRQNTEKKGQQSHEVSSLEAPRKQLSIGSLLRMVFRGRPVSSREEREKTVKSSAVLQVGCEVGKERQVGGRSPATEVREVR